MQRGAYAQWQALRDSRVKSHIISGLTGGLCNLLVKEDSILDKCLDPTIHRIQKVEEEISVSLKVSTVKSQLQGDSSIPDIALQEMTAREVAKNIGGDPSERY